MEIKELNPNTNQEPEGRISIKLSTSLLIISWIPMIQLWLILFNRERNLLFFIVLFVLSLIGGWCLSKSIPQNSKLYIPVRHFFAIVVSAGIGGGIMLLFLVILYTSDSRGDLLTVLLLSFMLFKLITNSFLIVLFLILLFGIPVFFCIFKREIERSLFSFVISPLPLIVSIISALLLCIVIFLICKETKKEDKPHLSILKFILASLFFLWLLNLGIHLYYRLPELMVTWRVNRNTFFIDLESFATLKLLVFIVFIILNLLFFGGIFLKGKFRERQPLLFSSTGFLLMTGMLALLFCLINSIPLLTSNYHRYSYMISQFGFYEWIVIPISFVTIIGPVLMIALVLVVLGGVLSFFKRGLRQNRFLGVVRKKAVVISLATVILYVLLFKALWPFQDPVPDFLFRVVKNTIVKPGAEPSMFGNASYFEFLSYGKRVVKLLVNKLDDDEVSARELSADFLRYLGDERAVESLIKALEDKNKNVRERVVMALSNIKDPRAVPPMIEALEKNKFPYDAIWLLGELGDPRFIDHLLKKLDDKDKKLRESVIDALGYFKEARVVDKLIGRLSKEISIHLIQQIICALERITGEDYSGFFYEASQWWRQWWKQNREEFRKKW